MNVLSNFLKDKVYENETEYNKPPFFVCPDAHTNENYPPWSQYLIRKGIPMELASFSVNFVTVGRYKFYLRRWPAESRLALGAGTNDAVSPSAFDNGKIDGKVMKFTNAYLQVAGQKKEIKVDNNAESAVFEMEIPQGTTDLLAYFDMGNRKQCNAFYIDVEKVNW